ncbi:porin family protein [Bacteroidales bacterium OttesenSCG-928-B11]|nr:porin family protein [Bacteroidales bacterium OttesenSCG-928-B11]MDL2326941.1 porin family protein [Bacteroidales bacterium OttesenSCG-928-A14]
MKKYSIILVLAIASLQLNAQERLWKVNWDMNAPVGQTAEFIDNYSFRGFSIEGNWFVVDHLSLGINFSWGLFYENTGKISENIANNNAVVTGTQKRYNNFTPIMFNAKYHFGDWPVRPYIGFGFGPAWNETVKNIGLYQVYNKNWLFAIAPEVGILIPFIDNFGLNLSAKYQQGFWKDGQDLQTFTISVGFVFGDL